VERAGVFCFYQVDGTHLESSPASFQPPHLLTAGGVCVPYFDKNTLRVLAYKAVDHVVTETVLHKGLARNVTSKHFVVRTA
jgi:hypothetical protein